jgi:hypothetical protein
MEYAELQNLINCWLYRGDHRILALRHKILLLMIEGLARRGGAEVSPPARDNALVRKRTSAATFTNLIYLHSIFTSHCRVCQDSPDTGNFSFMQ